MKIFQKLISDVDSLFLKFFLLSGAIGALLIALAILAYWYDLHTRFYLFALHFPKLKHLVKALKNRAIPMRDGVKLFTDLYLPKDKGIYPAIVIRTPYGKSNTDHKYPFMATLYATQGFGVLVQDVRGKYLSEGEFTPFIAEEQDGLDTLEWVLKQNWCNGRVCFFGFSYLGTCSWLVAAKNPKGLAALVPMFCSQNVYDAWVDSGVPFLKDILYWLAKHHKKEAGAVNHEEIDEIVFHLPVLQFDKRLKNGVDTFKLWMTHLEQRSNYWTSISVDKRREAIKVPIFFAGGWFDRFVNNMIEEFNTTVFDDPKSEEVRKSVLLIGPWSHHPAENYVDLPFPPSAAFRFQLSTFCSWIKKAMDGEEDKTWKNYPIRFYLLGKNMWCQSDRWPLSKSQKKQYFLHVDSSEEGVLEEEPQQEVRSSHFVYDPDNPFPSIGGNMIYGNGKEGPRDVSSYLQRTDVVTWFSKRFEKPLILCGPASLVLHVASSAKDTDFYVKMCVCKSNKRIYHLLSGFVRMRHLDSVRITQGIQSGQAYRIELPLGHLAYEFSKTDRICLILTSSDFPNHGRNLNTGGSNEGDMEEVKAHQTVLQGGIYRSELTLTTVDEKDLIAYP